MCTSTVCVHTTLPSPSDPTPDDSLGFKWEAATEDNLHYLALKPSPTMEADQRQEVSHSLCIISEAGSHTYARTHTFIYYFHLNMQIYSTLLFSLSTYTNIYEKSSVHWLKIFFFLSLLPGARFPRVSPNEAEPAPSPRTRRPRRSQRVRRRRCSERIFGHRSWTPPPSFPCASDAAEIPSEDDGGLWTCFGRRLTIASIHSKVPN